jgi:RimJ/RimL family protein N-acetyltransferase
MEIGITMACEHQGKGYAIEAVNCLLHYVFAKIAKHRVIAVADTRNTPAVRLLERVGMRREVHFIENIWFKGSWGGEYLCALLDEEWLQSRGSSRP